MSFKTVLLLLVGTPSALLDKINHPGTEECYFVVNVPAKRMVSFNNINWPEKYSSGEVCIWIFQCPQGSNCHLRCSDVGLPKTDDCYMDKLLVYSKGTASVKPLKSVGRNSQRSILFTIEPQREEARVYCGRTAINVRSNESKIAMALVSSESSPGGRFRCTVTPEKWGGVRKTITHPPSSKRSTSSQSTVQYEN